MAAAEGSFMGLAFQSAFGTPNTTDADFKYLLFRQGQASPNNIVIPLDPEVGGGALARSMVKVGVNFGGSFDIVPRPETLGHFFYGATGKVVSAANRVATAVHAAVTLSGSPQTINTGITSPSASTKLELVASAANTANVSITGTIGGAAAQTEVIALTGTTPVLTAGLFTLVTEIVYPAGSGTVSIGWKDGSYTHTFTLDPADNFSAPYFTVRSAPANMWGEQYEDARLSMLALNWRGANFVDGMVTFLGRKPSKVATTTWDALANVDSGPQFISPLGAIELPTGTNAHVLNGSLVCSSAIPLDEQYVVGDYSPEGLDIVSRSFALQLIVKINDADLYTKMTYDPANGNAWVASLFKEANIKLEFSSDRDAAVVKGSTATSNARSYKFSLAANGSSGDNANIFWSAAPLSIRAQRQMVMMVTGQIMASPTVTDPVTFTLTNRRASYG